MEAVVSGPLATHDHVPGGLDHSLEFLKRTRSELRSIWKVRVWPDRLQVIDVNKDIFEVRGVGYLDPDIVPLLRAVNTAFNPETIHQPVNDFKEFGAGRRYPWAYDRVM
jgi:hypothetical protein